MKGRKADAEREMEEKQNARGGGRGWGCVEGGTTYPTTFTQLGLRSSKCGSEERESNGEPTECTRRGNSAEKKSILPTALVAKMRIAEQLLMTAGLRGQRLT